MRWRDLGESGNVEDRRGRSSGPGGLPFRGVPLRGKSGLLVLAVVLIAGYYGVDLTPMLTGGAGAPVPASRSYAPSALEQDMARFSSVVLKTTEEVWDGLFRGMGKRYEPPRLVLYSGTTSTACGHGQAAMGPFYCPGDSSVFLDLAFYRDMKTKLGGGGDFAQGYVIAHEVGHHVQHLLGIERTVRRLQSGATQKQANELSVKMELQADCFAGVWGRYVARRGLLEAGDLEEALRTAEAIGDDRLQKQSGRVAVPDSFTHGTSRQRRTWFKRGFDSGNPEQCDTFASGN